ncbi:hypothetical protein [Thermococcus sp. JdF3]|uniref:hypothetical protein n=1 Tax=Thermococcus sp. JdF3 TaxID=1638258 RepID=UPI0014389C6D|nr:hypothetical protein [Thermococcus sp. JdF3]NJE00444.1 hypothetical protein [Thermococcus sp. JdF3]
MKYLSKLSTIKRYGTDPHWWKNVFVWHVGPLVYRTNKGFSVMSEYWNHLIILDACRFDIFKEEIKKTRLYTQGKLEYRISKGSMTAEFLLNNFGEGKFKNIVYITANPFVDMLLKGKFYKIIPVWKDGWDDNLNTVHPRTVYEYTKLALKEYPTKRFIIHFMQPHFPYLTLRLPEETGFSKHREAVLNGVMQWRDRTVWDLVAEGRLPIDIVEHAYRENLRIALKYVEKLVKILDGKIVITSDHGEAFGERLHRIIPINVYGHPKGIRINPLVKVPWLIIERPKKRRDVESLRLKKAIKNLKLKGKV